MSRTIRVVKREERALAAQVSTPSPAPREADAGRRMQAVVSGWVRERRQQTFPAVPPEMEGWARALLAGRHRSRL